MPLLGVWEPEEEVALGAAERERALKGLAQPIGEGARIDAGNVTFEDRPVRARSHGLLRALGPPAAPARASAV